MTDRPTIAVIGSGAVGLYYGGRLAQHGHDVRFLVRSDFEAMKSNGLRAKSCAGDFVVPPESIHLYRDVAEMPKADLVLVTLKTTSNHLFDPLIRPLLNNTTAILTLQNGLGNEDKLATLFGAERILGGMAFTCINRLEPGVIDHSAHGYIRIGEFLGGPSERVDKISRIFSNCQVPCDVLSSLRYGRWEKLLWNIPFNGLSTVLNQTTDAILATAEGELLVRAIMKDVIQAASADGVTLPSELIDVNVSRTREMGSYRTSMHVDRQMRRPLEVEAIIGEPWRVASRNNQAAVPHLENLYWLAVMTAVQLDRRYPG